MAATETSNSSALWAPGIRLMGNLQFGGKALLICLMFMVPVGWLTYNFYVTSNAEIAFTELEVKGAAYAKDIFPLMDLAQQLRRDATAAALGNAPATLTEVRAKLKEAQTKLEATDKQLGADVGSSAAYAAVKAAFVAAESTKAAGDVFKAHTAHIEAIKGLIGAVADGSNLSLDPDIDSYYVMDAALFRMPDVLEESGKLRGLGLAAMRAGSISADQLETFNAVTPIANFQLSNMKDSLVKASKANADLATRLNTTEALDATQRFLELARTKLMGGKDYGPEIQTQYLAAGNKAIGGQYALTQRMLAELEGLLQQRAGKMKQKRNVSTTVLVLGLLLAGYFFYSFYRVTSNGLQLINRHVREIAQGDFSNVPQTPVSRDEPAQVIKSLIDMQQILGNFERAQAEMSSRHAAGVISHYIDASRLPGTYGTLALGVNDMVKSHVDVKFQAIGLIENYVRGEFDESMPELPGEKRRVTDSVNGARDSLSAAAQAAVANQRVVIALNKATTNIMIADTGNNIIFMNDTVQDMMQRNEAELRKVLPHFNARQQEPGSPAQHAGLPCRDPPHPDQGWHFALRPHRQPHPGRPRSTTGHRCGVVRSHRRGGCRRRSGHDRERRIPRRLQPAPAL
jgi:methyl-accepting chemotaxis protein